MDISLTAEEITRDYPFLKSHVADFKAETGVGYPILSDDEVGRLKCFTEPFPAGLFSSKIKVKKGRLYVIQEVNGCCVVTILPPGADFQAKDFPNMTHLVHKYWGGDDELVIKIIGLDTRDGAETLLIADAVPT